MGSFKTDTWRQGAGLRIIAIDPGNVKSAFVIWDGLQISEMGILENEKILRMLSNKNGGVLVIEQIRSYGMAVGMTVFDTVFWSGRFYQSWHGDCYMMPRMDVKQHICRNSRAKDSNIRQALIDRFEPALLPRQRPKKILKGVSKDIWAALALAVTWHDKHEKGET